MPPPQRRTSARLTRDRVFFWFLAALIALSPLPWGSIPLWAASGWTILVCACLIAWGVAVVASPGQRIPGDGTAPAVALFAVLAACIVTQIVPSLPVAWQHPLWQDARAAGLDVSGSISINRFATGSALMKLIAAAGVFWLALATFRASEVKERVVRIIIVVQVAYALWGVIAFLHPFGFDPAAGGAVAAFARRFRATFVNPNTYAAFANLGALCCAMMLIRVIGRGLITDRGSAVLRRSFVKAVFENGGLWLAGFVLLASASLLSASRGGIVALAAGLFVLALTHGKAAVRRRLALPTAIALIAAVGFGTYWLSGEKVATRWASGDVVTDLEGSGRIQFWQIALGAVEARPWLGSGFGTFDDVSVIGRPAELPAGRIERAHNDYLEFAAELGIPLTVVWITILASLLLAVRQRWRTDDRHAPYAALALAAAASLALHSVVDFPLQVPANAFLFACLLALALGRSSRSTITAPASPAAARTA